MELLTPFSKSYTEVCWECAADIALFFYLAALLALMSGNISLMRSMDCELSFFNIWSCWTFWYYYWLRSAKRTRFGDWFLLAISDFEFWLRSLWNTMAVVIFIVCSLLDPFIIEVWNVPCYAWSNGSSIESRFIDGTFRFSSRTRSSLSCMFDNDWFWDSS